MNAMDSHGPDWRSWIQTNLSAGCDMDDMASRMMAAGWTQALAQEALAIAADGLRNDAVPALRPELPTLGRHDIGGHLVDVTMRFAVPAIAVCENALSLEECSMLLAYADACGLRPSTVVDEGDGRVISHPERTSSSLMLERSATALIATVEARLGAITQWPTDRGEGLQILRYTVGQEYRPHFDAFPDGKAGDLHRANGGQRVSTVLVYLKSPEGGGGTSFPNLGLSFRPKVGTAIIFHNVDRHGKRAERTLHAGEPVVDGEKIILTYWQRERGFGHGRCA